MERNKDLWLVPSWLKDHCAAVECGLGQVESNVDEVIPVADLVLIRPDPEK